MAADYYGKGCKFFRGQWENPEDYKGSNINYKEDITPILVFCVNIKNTQDVEGNCCEGLCPLKKKITEFIKKKEL